LFEPVKKVVRLGERYLEATQGKKLDGGVKRPGKTGRKCLKAGGTETGKDDRGNGGKKF